MADDRLLNRVDTLVGAIRKIDTQLEDDHPMRARMLERRAEYQLSLANIQEFGVERPRKLPAGVTIDVPADVMKLVKE